MLKNYQLEAIDFLRKKRKALLNMGCGTGKSVTALLASSGLKTAVVCPPVLLKKWAKEAQFASEFTKLFKVSDVSYISSYDKKTISSLSKECIIVDEAHALVDYPKAKDLIVAIRKAKCAFFLTATPMLHSPNDLYWIIKLCKNINLSREDYIMKFCDGRYIFSSSYNYKKIAIPQGFSKKEEFKELLKDITYKYFRKEDVDIKYLSLGESPIKNKAGIEDFSRLEALLAFEKIRNKQTFKFIDELISKHSKLILFYFHLDTLKILKEKYPQAYSVESKQVFSKRYAVIDAYLKSKEKVLLLNYKSSGVGLDIPNIDACLFVESTWSHKTDYQAYMRLYRFNRITPLQVYRLVYNDEKRKLVTDKKTEILKGF